MKKSLHIITLLLLTSVAAHAQKEFTFKMKVNPNRHYAMLMKMNMNMEMNVSGDTAMVNKMKNAGQSFPVIMDMETGMNADIKTGSVNTANKIPFTITMQTGASKMKINGKDNPMPTPQTNQTMQGTYTTDGKMSIDSITGKTADEATKETMKKAIEGIQANVKFPDKPMKIGDTFTQDIPMNLPIAGMDAKMTSKATYTLTSIANNKAYFDLKYAITMDMDSKAIAMNMTGGGDGKMVYDIPASYAVNMISNMTVNYNMTMPQAANMKMDGKMKMQMENTTTITGN